MINLCSKIIADGINLLFNPNLKIAPMIITTTGAIHLSTRSKGKKTSPRQEKLQRAYRLTFLQSWY